MSDDRIDEFSDEALATHALSFAPGWLDGRVVLVTGGAGGIGSATAWAAARLGARVVVCGRTQEKVDRVAAAIRDRGLACEGRRVDVRDRASVDEMIAAVWSSHGALDLLVHSAGGQFPQPAIDFSVKGWKTVVELNLDGSFHVMQAAARRWRDEQRGGSIVNVVVSPRGLHHVAHTCAARAGVMAFSQQVAIEWAPLGIRVNCVAPGTIRTEGWRVYAEDVRRRYPNTNPLRTTGTPWEVAEACLFVGGPTGRFITGEILEITGGGHLWGEVWTTDKPRWFAEASRFFDPGDE